MLNVAASYLRDSFGFYERCADRYGDPFTLPTPWGRLVVTGRAEGIETIFSASPGIFEIFAATVVEPFLGPTSLMVSSGTEHMRNRRLLMPRFHTKYFSTYGRIIEEITAESALRWRVGERLVAQTALHSITLEIILRIFFGANSEQSDVLREALVDIQKKMGPAIAFLPIIRHEFGGFGPWAHFQSALRRLDDIIYDMIAESRAADSTDDILGMLIRLRDQDGIGFSDAEIRDEIVSLVYAGHETLAASLAWALYWIHRNPEVLARLREELSDIPQSDGFELLIKAPYLEAVCNESLRLNPVVPEVTRQLKEPLRLLGYDLPVGVAVAPSIALAHQNESVYPQPREFRPERFIGHKYSAFEFLPFGGGTHRCLGASLAKYEMKVVLSTLLRHCRFNLLTSGVVKPTRRGVLLGPHDNVVLAVEELNAKGLSS